MNKNTSLLLGIVALVLVLGAGYYLTRNSPNNEQVMCAQDVQLCPDGSYVARTGPNCEFAMCPKGEEVSASTTKNFYDANQKVGFDYLDNFYISEKLTEFIHPVEWPPQITVSTSTYVCNPSGNVVSGDGKVGRKTINGKLYCLTTLSEGAAGSVYTTYKYEIPLNKKTVALSFVVRVPQCANYDEPQKSQCEKEKLDFNIDQMIDKVFSTVKFAQ